MFWIGLVENQDMSLLEKHLLIACQRISPTGQRAKMDLVSKFLNKFLWRDYLWLQDRKLNKNGKYSFNCIMSNFETHRISSLNIL